MDLPATNGLPARIRARRLMLKLKQRELGYEIAKAENMGKEPNARQKHNGERSVQRWEAGESLPRLRTLEAVVAPCLQTSLAYLLGFEDLAPAEYRPPQERVERVEREVQEIRDLLRQMAGAEAGAAQVIEQELHGPGAPVEDAPPSS